jgi:hypothetical protein
MSITDSFDAVARDSKELLDRLTDERGLLYPVGETVLLGRTEKTKLLTCVQRFTADGVPFIYFLTDCCGAAASGGETGIHCKGCYRDGYDEVGGVYTKIWHGDVIAPTHRDRRIFEKGQSK